MSDETVCEVCQREHGHMNDEGGRICARRAQESFGATVTSSCYRLGYTRELAAREAAEKELAAEWKSTAAGEEERADDMGGTADKLLVENVSLKAALAAAEKENTRHEEERRAFVFNLRCVAAAMQGCANGYRTAMLFVDALNKPVDICKGAAEAFERLHAELSALLPTSDKNANRKPEPCPPGCAEHGEQGS